jgi:tRNA threonylcarbamoyladenosine biosynthesis protein TsaE
MVSAGSPAALIRKRMEKRADKEVVKQVNSPEEMIALGCEWAGELSAGSILALQGGLGAGKTHFTKGVATGLGCNAEVTSPTFTLAHEYTGGRLPLYHFDFYRMDSEDEVLRIGWDEYLDEAGVVVVEWPDKFPGLLPPETIWLKIDHDGESRIVRRLNR